jgi:hypothetical protein
MNDNENECEIDIDTNIETNEINNAGVVSLTNEITLQDIRDGVVAPSTNAKYSRDIFAYLTWCNENQPSILTTYGMQAIVALQRQGGERHNAFVLRLKQQLSLLLQNAHTNHIVVLSAITPENFFEYLRKLRKKKGKCTIWLYLIFCPPLNLTFLQILVSQKQQRRISWD